VFGLRWSETGEVGRFLAFCSRRGGGYINGILVYEFGDAVENVCFTLFIVCHDVNELVGVLVLLRAHGAKGYFTFIKFCAIGKLCCDKSKMEYPA
jgi:hypothetical protein